VLLSAGRSFFSIVEAPITCPLDLSGARWLALIESKTVVFQLGYYVHDLRALRKHQDLIRRFFRPRPDLEETAASFVQSVREDVEVLIGLHVRRGDYAHWRRGQFYYSLEEYVEIAKSVARLFSERKVGFVICSNEPVPMEAFSGLDVRSGLGSVMGDLLSLSLCDYIVGPPSSFSRWAAFYGGRPILSVEQGGSQVQYSDFRSVFDLSWLNHSTDISNI
jgi:hypothetical protein